MNDAKTTITPVRVKKASFQRGTNGVVVMTLSNDGETGFQCYCFTDAEFNDFYEQVRKANYR